MGRKTLANRVETLEHRVDALEQLPGRVAALEVQVSQFREEVRVEFSAIRTEMKEFHDEADTVKKEYVLPKKTKFGAPLKEYLNCLDAAAK